MNEAEIDAQWKREKRRRNQDLLDYMRSAVKEGAQRNREQPIKSPLQETKDEGRETPKAERPHRRGR